MDQEQADRIETMLRRMLALLEQVAPLLNHPLVRRALRTTPAGAARTVVRPSKG